MRFLVDNALSPLVADALRRLGHDAIHVRDVGIAHTSDDVIFDRADAEDRVIVSADTDFGFILASRKSAHPSVILFRGNTSRDPQQQAKLLENNLPQLSIALGSGSVVVFDGARIRIRALPIT